MSPEIMKVFSLSSALSVEDQVKFLNLLVSTKDRTVRKELIDRAVIGERVWDKKLVV
jgi:hypothetical protein